MAKKEKSRRCSATKPGGEQCGNWAMVGSEVCHWHDKSLAKRSAEKGGSATGTKTTAERKRLREITKATWGDTLAEMRDYCAGQCAVDQGSAPCLA